MSDLNVELDGGPFEKAMRPILESLKEFRALVVQLDNSPTGRLSKEMQTLKTTAVGALTEIERGFQALPKALEKELKEAGVKSKAQAKASGKMAGDAFADGVQESVAKVRLSVPAVQLAGGAKASMSTTGMGSLYDLQTARNELLKTQERDALVDSMGLAPALASKSARESADAFVEAFKQQALRVASASPLDPRTLLGLTPNVMQKSAAASADVFKQQFALEAMREKAASRVDARMLLGLTPNIMQKSAAASADVFKQQFALESMREKAASKVDARTLLGLTPNIMQKSAAASADVFREAFAMEALKGKAASNIDVQTLLGLTPTAMEKSAKASASVFQEAFAKQKSELEQMQAAARAQVARATAAPDGAFSRLTGARAGQVVSPESADKMKAAQLGLTRAQENLNEAMRTGHSAARGLASGFNAMWLTWGQLGPLLAGAAISNSFVQAIKQGSEFEQRLAAIRYLGGESAQAVGQLASAALQLSREGPVGPAEVASALKALSLAGLSAKEQLAAIKPTLNFAIAGELPLEKAAESLVAISSAFGYTAEGFGSVGDVISKAAAISMSSVESMTESFRQASTVAQQYGVTVEDAATSLALLSQVGIRGSAAGTAMRNMYNELMGTSKRARKVLEDTLKVDVIDNGTKAMRPLLDIMQDMAGALSKMDFESQQKALQALGNERGLKALSANLMAFNQQAKEVGKDLPNRLAEIRKQLEDAPGFAAKAAIGMGLTTKNQIAGVFASLQAALVESFGAISPIIQSTASQLRAVFNSEGFRSALSSLISGVAQLTQFLVEHSKELFVVAGAYVAGKAALLALAAMAPITAAAMTGLTAVLGGTALGVSAVGVAIRVAVASLGPIGAILAAAGTAWLIFGNKTKAATAEATFAIDTHYQATIEGIDKELDRLKKENKAMEDRLAGRVADRTVEAALAEDRLRDLHREEIAQKRVAHAALQASNARMRDNLRTKGGPGAADALKALDEQEARSAADLGATVTRAYQKERALKDKLDQLSAQAKINAENARKLAGQSRPIPTGPDSFNPDDLGGRGTGGDPFRTARKEFDNVLKGNSVSEAEAARRAKDDESKAKLMLAQRVLTTEEFENRRDEIAMRHFEERKALLEQEVAASESQREKLRAAYEKAKAERPNSVQEQDLDNELDSVANRIAEARQKLAELKSDQENAVREAEIRKLKPLNSQVEEMEKFLKSQGDALNYDLERASAALKSASMTEREAAIEQARLTTYIAFKKEEAKLEREIALYKKNGGTSTEALKNAEGKLEDLRGKLPGAQDEAAGKAGKIFDDQTMASNIQDLKKNLAQALMDAGKDGGKSLVNVVRQQLINKPFQIFLEAAMSGVAGFLGEAGKGIAGTLLGAFGLRAGGGPVSRGNTYLVGENGPELMTMGDSGYVHNAAQTERMRQVPAGGQQVSITVAPQINIDSRADQAQVASMVSRGMQESQKQMFEQLRAVGVVR